MYTLRTGVCTTDFENQKLYTADKLFARIRELGFGAVQFAFSSISETDFTPNGQIEIPKEIPYVAVVAADRAAAKYDLPIEVVNGTFNMAHPDAAVRAEGLRRFTILVEASAVLGAKYISLCSGSRNVEQLWTWSSENGTDEAWADMYETMLRAVEMAEKAGITLAIESEAANIIDTPENARRLMDAIGSKHLKMILDCANLFHRGMAHPENVQIVLANAFEKYGKDIVIAHGKDIRAGDGIDFCSTGLGIVDFAYTARQLRAVGYTGDMFLHGIYDEADMPRAREYWESQRDNAQKE